MKIESKTVLVNCDRKEVFTYLNNLNNFKELLPKDQYSNWQSTEEYCSFKIKAATIDLKKIDVVENEKILLTSGEKAPFPYELSIFIEPSDNACTANLIFDGEVNSFIKMMVQTPLTNLFNHIADRLVAVKSKN